jgi:hypothetical protein
MATYDYSPESGITVFCVQPDADSSSVLFHAPRNNQLRAGGAILRKVTVGNWRSRLPAMIGYLQLQNVLVKLLKVMRFSRVSRVSAPVRRYR